MPVKAGGVGVSFTCDGAVEVDTSTCAHCQRITDIPNRRRMHDVVDICRNCMRLICLNCADKPCTPFMRKVEAMEAEAYRRSQNAKVMGL